MSVRRSLLWMMASQGGNFVLQFGSTIILARLLTPYDMGVFTAALALVGILSIFQSVGVAIFVIREPENDPDMLSTAFTLNAMISIILASVIAGLSATGGTLLRDPGVQKVMLLLAPVPILSIPQFLPATLIEKAGQFRSIALVNLCRVIVTSSLTVALALAGLTYLSLAWGTLAGAFTSAIAFMIIGRRHLAFRLHLGGWRRIATFSGQQFAIQGVNDIAGRLADFALARIVGLAGLGLYGRAVSLNSAVWNNIHMVMGRVVLVDFAERHRRGDSLREAYLRTLNLCTVVLWPAFLGLAIVAGPAIRMLYGTAWIAAGPLLSMVSVTSVILVSITMTWELFAVCNQSHKQAKLEIFRTGIGSALFIGACFFGLTAAAFARIVDATISVFIYRPYVESMTETNFADFSTIYRRNGLLALAACAPSLAVMALWRFSPLTPMAYIATAIVLGGVAWLYLLRFTHHLAWTEITHISAKIASKIRPNMLSTSTSPELVGQATPPRSDSLT